MLVKCPKCELNYMESTDKMCKVCFREIHGTDMPEEQELCSVCNLTPVVTGKDVCASCFREMKAQRATIGEDDADEVLDEDENTIDDDMDEDLVGNEDMPEPEFREIDRNLSLDELGEQEEADAEEEDDEEL